MSDGIEVFVGLRIAFEQLEDWKPDQLEALFAGVAEVVAAGGAGTPTGGEVSRADAIDVPRHKHYWNYPHGIIEGRKESEIAVVRYCGICDLRQVAFASGWRKARDPYERDEHYS